MLAEREAGTRAFYSYRHIVRRALGTLWRARNPVLALVALIINLSCRSNYRSLRIGQEVYRGFDLTRGEVQATRDTP